MNCIVLLLLYIYIVYYSPLKLLDFKQLLIYSSLCVILIEEKKLII